MQRACMWRVYLSRALGAGLRWKRFKARPALLCTPHAKQLLATQHSCPQVQRRSYWESVKVPSQEKEEEGEVCDPRACAAQQTRAGTRARGGSKDGHVRGVAQEDVIGMNGVAHIVLTVSQFEKVEWCLSLKILV